MPRRKHLTWTKLKKKNNLSFFFSRMNLKRKRFGSYFFEWIDSSYMRRQTHANSVFERSGKNCITSFYTTTHTPTFSPFSGYCGQINVIYIKRYPCIPIFYYYYFFLKISFPPISPFFSSFVVPPQFSFAASLSNIFRLMIFYLQPPQSPLVLFEWTWFI